MSDRYRDLLRLVGLTSTPASPSEGDLWYRSDTDRVEASDGQAGIPLTVGPSGNLPVIRSGAWHAVPAYGAPSSANFPADRLFALPFWPGRSATVTGMAANVTLALIGGNIRFGIYSSDGVLPTTLLADYGTVTVGLTGVRSVTGVSTSLRPVLHYAVIARQGGILNLGMTARDTWEPIISETTPSLAGSLNSYYRDGVSGALPASFGAIAGTIQSPALSVQLT